jgi:hypothetical protein
MEMETEEEEEKQIIDPKEKEKDDKEQHEALFWAFKCAYKTSIDSYKALPTNWEVISTDEGVILEQQNNIYRIRGYCNVPSEKVLKICTDFKNKFIPCIKYETLTIAETFEKDGDNELFFLQFEVCLSSFFQLYSYANCIVKSDKKHNWISYTFIDDIKSTKHKQSIFGWIILTIVEKTITITSNINATKGEPPMYLAYVQDAFLPQLKNSINKINEINKNWSRYYF